MAATPIFKLAFPPLSELLGHGAGRAGSLLPQWRAAQKLQLLLMLMMGQPVLLLDEPFAGLDQSLKTSTN